MGEPLLDENPDRFCMFPIKYPVSMAYMIHSRTSLPYYLLSMQETLHDLSSYCRVLLPLPDGCLAPPVHVGYR